MIAIYSQILEILPARFRWAFSGLIVIYTVGGVLDMLGVASIMPFVGLLSDPVAFNNSKLGILFEDGTGFSINEVPVHYVGLCVLTLFIFGNCVSILSLWFSVRFAARLNVYISGEVVNGFFERGYNFIRRSNPSVHANYTIKEVDRAIAGGVLQLCLGLSKTINIVLIVFVLALASPFFTFVFTAVTISAYIMFYFSMKSKMTAAGDDIVNAGANTLSLATGIYTSSKEIILRGNVNYFVKLLKIWISKCHAADEAARVYPAFPKYIIESVAFIMLLGVPIYQSMNGIDYKSSIPLVALFAYSGYRLLPSVQQVFSSLSILKFNASVVDYLHRFLMVKSSNYIDRLVIHGFKNKIEFEKVSYKLDGVEVPILDDVSFTVAPGEKIAVVGYSGSGKTTLLDIFLGLIIPTSGQIYIDETTISCVKYSWAYDSLGYTPQSPLIFDGTLKDNVAFGIAPSQIDSDSCYRAIKNARFEDILVDMPEGLETNIGSNGRSLSGGEVQRVAVARAFYHNPDVLVFDEPSSALDPVISGELLKELVSLGSNKTVLVVTHDWEHLHMFDRVLILDSGKLIAFGKYVEVVDFVDQLRANYRTKSENW